MHSNTRRTLQTQGRQQLPHLLLLLAASLATACADVQTPTGPDQPVAPTFEISDATHSNGSANFYWLPPFVTPTPSPTGVFDPNQYPTVTVCRMANGVCASVLAQFTRTSGSGDVIVVDSVAERYSVQWKADPGALDPSLTYRVSVDVGSQHEGHADLRIFDPSHGFKRIDTGTDVVVNKNGMVNIAFRLEKLLPAWCGNVLTFDGGTLPPAWTLAAGPQSGLFNNRLQADFGQSAIVTALAPAPAGLGSLTVEYDAAFGSGPGFNDQQHGIDILTPTATYVAAEKIEDPCDSQSGASVGQYQSCGLQGKVSTETWTGGVYPGYSGSGIGYGVHYYLTTSPADHHVVVTYTDGQSTTTIRRLSDNAVVLTGYQVPIAGLAVANVAGLNVHAYSGTSIDNVRVTCR